ncbi:MAG: response regulator transcription factor [Flavobacteriales bacterium]
MEHGIALVDDHHLVRSGLATVVNNMQGYKVVLEASDGEEFIAALEQGPRPTIAVIDLNMPVMDGYETITWLRTNEPNILPLALTFDASDEALVRAVRLGARGFLLKNSQPEQLRNALDSLILTGYYHSDDMQRSLLDHRDNSKPSERERERILTLITERELEVLQHVCSEDEPTYEAIAAIMGVHRRTVDNYRASMFEKFNIKSKTGLVLFAMRWGLVEP